MQQKGHQFLLTARDKEITFELLNQYKIPFHNRGTGKNSLLGKLFYILKADRFILQKARSFKPDLFLSFASTYAAHVSKLVGKPHIALDDTEHAKLELLMYPPFTDTILTPACFHKNLGKKQIRFNSFMELCYLHPAHFSPDPEVLKLLNVKENEKYAIVRFVSWNASHDVGTQGLSNDQKIKLVGFLSRKLKVFVSSEGEMPAALEKYKFTIPTHYMHDALYYASIYVGEGGTTASEAALLGTPAVYINKLSMGYINEEKKAALLFQTTKYEEIETHIGNILKQNKSLFTQRLANLLSKQINITNFLVWFVENYPSSISQLKTNPNVQQQFI